MVECAFCERHKWKEDVLLETENFFVKVGYGIASPGQVMIITKKHYSCMAALLPELEKEYLELRKKVIQRVTEKYAAPYYLENGNRDQSVPHAHIHFIPTKSTEYEIKDMEDEMFKPDNVNYETTDWEGVRQYFRKYNKYLIFGINDKFFIIDLTPYKVVEDRPARIQWRYFYQETKGLKHVRAHFLMNDEDRVIDEKKRAETRELFKEK